MGSRARLDDSRHASTHPPTGPEEISRSWNTAVEHCHHWWHACSGSPVHHMQDTVIGATGERRGGAVHHTRCGLCAGSGTRFASSTAHRRQRHRSRPADCSGSGAAVSSYSCNKVASATGVERCSTSRCPMDANMNILRTAYNSICDLGSGYGTKYCYQVLVV